MNKMRQWQAASSSAEPLLLLLAALCTAPVARAAWTTTQFDNFFPGWNRSLHNLLDGERDTFTNANATLEACRDQLTHDFRLGAAQYWMVECLLQEFPEFRKAEAASASVILGLLPSILSQLGPTTAQLGWLGSRRPLLTLLLALGAPSFSRPTSQGYETSLRDELPFATLELGRQQRQRRRQREHQRGPKPRLGRVILTDLVEYTLTLTAVSNVAIVTYKLCIWAIESFALGFVWLPAIWVLLALPVYAVSLLVIYGHFQISPLPSEDKGVSSSNGWHWYDELTPCRDQDAVLLTSRSAHEKNIVVALAWFLHFGIVVHGVVGTLALAGLIFISVVDAVVIVLYFIASAVVCKLIIASVALPPDAKLQMSAIGSTVTVS
ncbi:hypothetical protein PG995_000059 [Apiospora arundinis]